MIQDHKKSNQDRLIFEFMAAKQKLKRTTLVLLAAVLLWPLGLFISGLVSLIIFGVGLTLWCVTTYIAFMHYLSTKKRLNHPGQ
jgi:hypothetical protein